MFIDSFDKESPNILELKPIHKIDSKVYDGEADSDGEEKEEESVVKQNNTSDSLGQSFENYFYFIIICSESSI